MKEAIVFKPEDNKIYIVLKDDKIKEPSGWVQRWWAYNGETCVRPRSNKEAAEFLNGSIVLEQKTYLDEYR